MFLSPALGKSRAATLVVQSQYETADNGMSCLVTHQPWEVSSEFIHSDRLRAPQHVSVPSSNKTLSTTDPDHSPGCNDSNVKYGSHRTWKLPTTLTYP